MPEQFSLPDGWTSTTIGDVCKTTSGGTPSRKVSSYYGGDIFWLKSGELNDATIYEVKETITQEGLKNSSAKVFPSGTLLIALYGATVGRLGILGKDAATNQAVCALFPSEILEKKYLFWFLRKERDQLLKARVGGAQPNISQSILRDVEIPIPPLPEQEKIVAKIEELFTQLDAGIAELKNAQAQLKRYRQSVLKSAVEGELTREWRKSHQGELEPASALLGRILAERREKWKVESGKKKYQEPAVPDVEALPDLPEGWVWASMDQLGEITGGLTKHGSKRKAYPIEIPYLRVANVYADELRLDEIKTIKVQEKELERTLLEKGDLLVVEGNGSLDQIGRVALWDGSIENCGHQNHLIKVRFNPVGLGNFILYWLLSNGGRSQITLVASSTSGLYTLSLSKVAALAVPLPPLAEQQRIIEKIERRLSVADEIEKELDEALVRAERLRQSVLKSAFEGRLV